MDESTPDDGFAHAAVGSEIAELRERLGRQLAELHATIAQLADLQAPQNLRASKAAIRLRSHPPSV